MFQLSFPDCLTPITCLNQNVYNLWRQGALWIFYKGIGLSKTRWQYSFVCWVNYLVLGLERRVNEGKKCLQQVQVHPSFSGLWTTRLLMFWLKFSILLLFCLLFFYAVQKHILWVIIPVTWNEFVQIKRQIKQIQRSVYQDEAVCPVLDSFYFKVYSCRLKYVLK